jgi:hypothetical protein
LFKVAHTTPPIKKILLTGAYIPRQIVVIIIGESAFLTNPGQLSTRVKWNIS